MSRALLLAALVSTQVLSNAEQVYAADLSVCTFGCEFSSIQAAVNNAEFGDTIELGAQTFFEHVVVVEDHDLTIRGSGRGKTVVDGGGAGSVFTLGRWTVTLEDMTIRNGQYGIHDPQYVTVGEVHIRNCEIHDNLYTGITRRYSALNIDRSIIHSNSIGIVTRSDLSMSHTTVTENRDIGVLGSGDSFIVLHSTISNNMSDGIKNASGHVTIINSTISNNGGIGVWARWAEVKNSTIVHNENPGDGGAGGIRVVGFDNVGSLTRSIVAGNLPQDCFFSPGFLSGGHNISGDDSCLLIQPTDLVYTNPILLPLADNGGPTLTHALRPGSPAIGAGGDGCEPTDQRGISRPQGAACDIGAFETATDELIVDFGIGVGLRAYRDTSWTPLHDLSARTMVTGDLDGNGQDELIVDFGSGRGVYIYSNDATWEPQLHSLGPNAMTVGDLDGNGQDELVMDFGLYGIHVLYNNDTWGPPIATLGSEKMVIGDLNGNGRDDVICSFGTAGVYIYYDDTTWGPKLHPVSPDKLAVGDLDGNGSDEVVFGFAGYGVWVYYNNSIWGTRLHPISPTALVAGDFDGNGLDDLVFDFGVFGIYAYYNNAAWNGQVHSLASEGMVIGDLDGNGSDELIIDFGSEIGLWARYNNSPADWRRLNHLNPGAMVTGEFGNGD